MRRFAPLAAVVAIVATGLAFAASADAAYKARISKGTLTLTGNGKGEKLQLRLRPGNKNVLQVDVGLNGTADFSLDRRRFKRIVVNAGAGADTVTIAETYGAFTNKEKTTLNGGPGADRLTGGRYGETYSGGPGADWVLGKNGADIFNWASPDGNDRFDGQDGNDVFRAAGSSGGDVFDITAGLGRVQIQRGADSIDVGTTETIEIDARGGVDAILGHPGLAALAKLRLSGGAGTDNITGGDGADVLTGGPDADTLHGMDGADTLVWTATDGSDTTDGDAGIDTFVANGTGGVDALAAAASGSRIGMAGPGGAVNDVGTAEKFDVNLLGGNDTFSGTGNLAALGAFDVDGGVGNDALSGTNGVDTIRGGDGNDVVDGNQGNDTLLLGNGDDVAHWDPGDGSDTVEGGAGNDRLDFVGSNGSETITIAPSGTRLHLTRSLGSVTIDMGSVERADYTALGGADHVVVQDLSATVTKNVYVNLAGAIGMTTGDGQADFVEVNGTSAANTIAVTAATGVAHVTGLSAAVHILNPESANDDVAVFGLGGADKLTGGTGLSVRIGLFLYGGTGKDTITGGDGADGLFGESEDDTIFGGSGADQITGGLGADTMNGQGGADNYTCLTAGDSPVQDGTDTIGPVCP